MKSLLLLCVIFTLSGASYPSDHTMVKFSGLCQEYLARQVMSELRPDPDMQEFAVELHENFRVKYADENSSDTVHHFCKISLCKNQKKFDGAKTSETSKAGFVPQWLTANSSGQNCKPENSDLLENPSKFFSDILPLNCDNRTQHLNNLHLISSEWKQSKTQLSPASFNVKTFDKKSSHSYEDFITMLKVKENVILSGGYKNKKFRKFKKW